MLQLLPIAFDNRRWSAGGFYDEERVSERVFLVDLALGWDVMPMHFFKCCVAIYLAFICMLCLVYSAVDICILLPLTRWLGALIGTPPSC